MKAFFIDETDRQRDTHKARAYFVLCGIVVDTDNLISIDKELQDILSAHNIISLKAARKDHLSKADKLCITKEVFDVLTKYKAEVRAAFLGELTMRTKRRVSDTYLGALDFLLERYFLLLKAEGTTGMVVMDSLNRATENELKTKYSKHIHTEGQVWIRQPHKVDPYRDRICPWLIFSEDNNNLVLQATDLIAASLNSSIWNCPDRSAIDVNTLPNRNEYLEIYWPLFAHSSKGRVDGWGVKIWN